MGRGSNNVGAFVQGFLHDTATFFGSGSFNNDDYNPSGNKIQCHSPKSLSKSGTDGLKERRWRVKNTLQKVMINRRAMGFIKKPKHKSGLETERRVRVKNNRACGMGATMMGGKDDGAVKVVDQKLCFVGKNKQCVRRIRDPRKSRCHGRHDYSHPKKYFKQPTYVFEDTLNQLVHDAWDNDRLSPYLI